MNRHIQRKTDQVRFTGEIFTLILSAIVLLFLASENESAAQSKDYQTSGVKDYLPVFYEKLAERQVYPLSWLQGDKGDFSIWRTEAQKAVSEHLAAGVSVCWMSTYRGLMVPGNNQTRGNSAYTMVHPGLSHYLDYPDIASIACPKPMMFCCGNKDDLFPLESINDAFKKMRMVWESQNSGNKLVTKLYDSPHEYNLAMQKDAFAWLDDILKNKR